MEHKERNGQIRQKILKEIADIEAFSRERAMDDLKADRMYQKAIVMSLINIGELSKSFTDDYLAAMPQIPWKAIRGFRNIASHQYEIIDFDDVQKTIRDDIPILRAALEAMGD